MGLMAELKEKRKKPQETEKKSGSLMAELQERKKYLSIDTNGVDDNYINTFISDANNFLSTAEEEYSKIGWGTASSAFDSRNNAWKDLSSRYDTVKAWLYKNRDKIGEESYKSINEALDSYHSGANSVVNTFKSAKDFYSQFDTEESYNTYKNRQEMAKSEQGVQGWNKYLEDEKTATEKAEAERKDETFWEKIGRYLGGGIVDTTLPTAGVTQTINDLRVDDSYKKPTEDWTEEQKNIFGYLYIESPEKAYQYAVETNNSINSASEEEALKKIAESASSGFWEGLGHTTGAIVTAPFGLADYLYDLALANAGRPITADGNVSPFEYSQAVTGGISSNLNETYGTLDEDIPIIGGKGWGDAYGLGTSIVQSAYSGLTLGSAGTLISYFGQGAAAGVDDALSRGASEEQAVLYGVSLGAFEGIAESIGVDRLFKIGSSSTFKELLKNTLRQAGAEGMEEGLTSILSNIADNVIMQDQSNFYAMVDMYMSQGMSEEEAKKKAWMDSVEGVAFDTIAGAVSGEVHGGVATSIQTGISNHNASKLYGNNSQMLVDEALGSQFSNVKAAGQKYQDKLSDGKKLSGWNLNELLEVTDKSKLKSTILKRLGELGETSDVTAVANVLIRQAMGEELSSKDTNILNNSKAGHIVLAEINKDNIKSGGLGNKWAENIGTRIINPQAYNKAHNDAVKMVKTYHKKAEEDAVKEEISEAQKSLPNNVTVSGSGKTIYKDEEGNSHDVNIKGIVSTDKGDVKVELDNGKTVSTKSLSFSTKEEGLMYEMVARMEVAPETANELINSFKPTNASQAAQYFTGVPLAYKYGTINYEEGLKNIPLSDKAKKLAFNRGKMDATTNAKTNRGVAKGNATKKGGIIFDGDYVYDESTANELQKASMPYIEVIDQMSNLETHVFESKVIKGKRVAYIDGKWRKAPNGYFKDGNKIYIDINAGNAAEGAMLYTMSHEITHYIREWNAKGFKELGDFLISEYGKMGVSVNALIEAQKKKIKKRYNEEGKVLPSEAKLFDMAYEELVADAMSDMLTDPKAYEKLVKLKQQNRTLWEKIGEAIKAILEKFKSALGIYKTEKPTVAREAYLARGFSSDVYNKLQDLYIKAFVEADANYEASIGMRNLNDFAEAKNENGEPLFQYRAMEEDESTYREMLHKWGKMTGEQIDNLFATIDNAMELIKDNLEVLDYAWEADIDDRAFSPVKPNSDKLYQVSLDFSTLCRKRILQQTVQAQLQEALNKPLSREEGIAIRDALMALQEEGRQIEVACALCYVESARMKSPEQIKKFINNREKVIKEFFANKSGGNIKEKIKQAEADARARLGVGNTSLKSLPGKVAQEIRDAKKVAKESYKPTAEEQKLIEVAQGMSVTDFTSPEGLENLAKKYPRLFDAYTSYIRNATKSKGIENDTWWRAGDSTKIGDVLIANMNKENGLRTQSWSDFQVIHILDYIASTIELATRNTKAQAYSKVPDYVELMGLTGVMINMSLIPTAAFNGTLDYDSVEGIDYKRALELRDKYPKTAGTICIGVDNVQIKLLLADTTIDYVIPYHRSGMSKALRKLMHIPTWFDYELYQSESNLSRADAEKKAKKYGVKLLNESDPNYHKGTSFSEWFDIKEAQQVAKKENANPTDKAKQKQYGVMYGGYMAMQNAANNYLKLCAERGLAPKFSHEKADFTTEANYWKLLIDRKMVDNITGEVIEQQTIKPVFNEGEIMRILNDELARYPKVKEDQDYAIRTVTEKFLSGEIKGGMSAEAIAKVMKKPVDNVTNVNILASVEGDTLFSDRDSSYEDLAQPITTEDVKALRSIGQKTVNKFSSEDIKKAQKWAYKFYQELGTKSPFFRAWFGDWRQYDVSQTKIVDTKSDNRKSIVNKDTKWEIQTSKKVHKETSHHLGSSEGNAVKYLPYIDDITENAVLFNSEISYKDNPNSLMFHTMYAYTEAMGYPALLKLKVEELFYYNTQESGELMRDYILQSIEEESVSKRNRLSRSNHLNTNSSVISIADLFKLVKGYDSSFKPNAVNPLLLNNDGTPKVFYHGTDAKFSVFDIERAGSSWNGDSRLGKGFYFAYTEDEALRWTEGTNVIKAYLNLKNPLNVDAPTPKNIAKEIDKYIANKIASFDENSSWISKEQYIKNLERIKDMYMNDVGMFINEFKYDDNGKMTDGIREFLSSLGYDGIVSKDEVVAFYPEQIKSATDNIGTFNKAEEDIHYSDRDSYAISDRTLLANALESVAKNDIEKTKLSEYKAKIALIESEQAKLTETRAKIKELSFAKGKRDTKAIKSLQFEANQMANRINTYDKQILNLESTSALKNVLEREKTMLRKRLEQKGKDALRKQKEKDAKKVRELMESRKEAVKKQKEKDAKTVRELLTRHTESRKKAIEGRHKTEMRHKIKNVVSDLNKLLLNPTKEQHVPIGLQKVVAEALDAINMDTMNAEERVAYYNDLISKSSNPDEIAMLKKKRDFFEYRDMNFKDRITALKNAYAEFKESDDPLIRNAHNDAIEDLIKNTADSVGNKSLKDMSLGQLEAVYDMYKAILATVRNTNKMFKEGRQATVTENSEAVKGEVKEIGGHNDRVRKFTKGIKSFTWSLLKPIYALKRIGSKTLTALFDNVRAGEETYAVDINEAREFFAEKSKQYNYNTWDFKKRFDFKDSAGNSFALSLEQIMSLYAYSKREQADRHLEVGGFVFDDSIEVTEKNKFGIPVKYEVNDATPYRLRVEDLAAVISTLTADQKGFIDEMQTYLSEVMGAKGNEVSLAMYDIKMFKEKHYFPLKTSKYFREFNPEQTANPMLRNSGFTKKTVPQAGNPIVLSNFMEVWTSHVNDMSMYHSFVLPLEDFMRVYNYSSTAGGYDSVQQYIKNAYGAEANQYIERLMQDINGGVVSNNLPNGWLKMFGKFKKATVAASLSTIVQQPTAIIRAMALINPRYFVGISLKDGHKKTWEEIKKYAPIAIIKEMGGIDVGSGRQAKDFITAQSYKGLGKVKGFFTDSSYRDSIFMWGATKADELGWNSIWKAVKREVASKQKLQPVTEEFFKACGERFTEVVTQTQVYDSVFARSGIMRDKGDLNKFATSFMGEPTTSFNMIYNAILSAKRDGSKAQAVKTISAVYASIVGAAAMASLIYALRDDDEDESYLEKWAEAFGNKLSSEIWIHNMIPYIRDIASIFEGWDVERPDMSIISDIKSSFDKIFKVNDDGEFEWKVDFSDFDSVYSAIENFGGSIASAFGLPLKNLMRDTKAIFNGFKAMSDDVEGGDFGGAFIEGFTGNESGKSDKLYDAIINGDDARLEIYKKGYKTEQAYETAVRTALRENDSRIHEAAQARYDGNIAEYTRIAREIIAEGNFTQDTVVGAINAEISAIKKGESTGEEPSEDKDEVKSIYSTSDLNSAFDNGDTSTALEIIDDLINTKVANGKTEKEAKSSLRSSMTSYWKPLYKEAYQAGNSSEMARIRQILYSSGLYGTANDVVKTAQTWLKD